MVVAPPLPRLPLLLAFFSITQLGKMTWNPTRLRKQKKVSSQ